MYIWTASLQSKLPESIANDIFPERLLVMDVQKDKPRLDRDYVYIRDRPPDKMSQQAEPKHQPYSSTVSISTTEQWEKELMEDPKNRLALSALSANNAASILTQRSTVISDTQTFNIKVGLEGAPITNQKSSGRCWLFAATNVFRVTIMKRYNLKEFELSQAYLFYWDKLEKANWFLEQILDTVQEDLEGRLVQTLLASPVGDGGQWDMVANLVEKYGLVFSAHACCNPVILLTMPLCRYRNRSILTPSTLKTQVLWRL